MKWTSQLSQGASPSCPTTCCSTDTHAHTQEEWTLILGGDCGAQKGSPKALPRPPPSAGAGSPPAALLGAERNICFSRPSLPREGGEFPSCPPEGWQGFPREGWIRGTCIPASLAFASGTPLLWNKGRQGNWHTKWLSSQTTTRPLVTRFNKPLGGWHLITRLKSYQILRLLCHISSKASAMGSNQRALGWLLMLLSAKISRMAQEGRAPAPDPDNSNVLT